MKTLKHSGNRIPWTNSTGSDVASGEVVVLESGTSGKIGIAVGAIANGATGELCIGGFPEGVHELAKNSGEVFTAFQKVYWDDTNNWLTGTASGNTLAGSADAPYASAAVLAGLILNR